MPRPILSLSLAALALLALIGALAPDGARALLVPAVLLFGAALASWRWPGLQRAVGTLRANPGNVRAPAPRGTGREHAREARQPGGGTADDELLAAIYALSPAEFERFSHRLLMAMGYRDVRVTGKSGDNGIDIVMRDGAGRLCVAQCKRYRGRVPPAVVRELLGVMAREAAAQGFLITTGKVSSQAESWAGTHQIKVIDAERLIFHARRLRTGTTDRP